MELLVIHTFTISGIPSWDITKLSKTFLAQTQHLNLISILGHTHHKTHIKTIYINDYTRCKFLAQQFGQYTMNISR